MKTAGWILIALGIMMILVRGFTVPVKKKVLDIGPVEINKTENQWVGWPIYAGCFITLAGVVLVVANKRK